MASIFVLPKNLLYMPLKKSAHLLILLGISSVSLVIFSANVKHTVPFTATVAVQCCSQIAEARLFSPWEIISQMMLRSAA